MAESAEIVVNGERRRVPEGTCVRDLVVLLGADPLTVVVELNGAIVSFAKFGRAALGPGDVVEVVRFVGGG